MNALKRTLAATLLWPRGGLMTSRIAPARAVCRLTAAPYTPEAWSRIAPQWADLVSASPHASFFLQLDWVETWLEVFGSALRPSVVTIENGGEMMGICLLTPNITWQGPFPVRRLHLNTAGEAQPESVCTEFSALLCRPGWEGAVASSLAEYLAHEPWEEFVVHGASEEACQMLEPVFEGCSRQVQWSTDYYVDLAALRLTGRGYVDGLSRNTRPQVKRAIKLYQAEGPLTLTPAADPASAGDLFRELVTLHQATWTRRGQPGAFSAARVCDFHNRLIARGMPRGTVHLLRVSAAETTIGVLYHFVDKGRVYFYQSGLHYRDDNRYKPGFVAHALAIDYWKARGLDQYHFLAGEEVDVRYKRSLATSATPLGWLTFQRPTLKLRTISRLRTLKRRLKPLL